MLGTVLASVSHVTGQTAPSKNDEGAILEGGPQFAVIVVDDYDSDEYQFVDINIDGILLWRVGDEDVAYPTQIDYKKWDWGNLSSFQFTGGTPYLDGQNSADPVGFVEENHSPDTTPYGPIPHVLGLDSNGNVLAQVLDPYWVSSGTENFGLNTSTIIVSAGSSTAYPGQFSYISANWYPFVNYHISCDEMGNVYCDYAYFYYEPYFRMKLSYSGVTLYEMGEASEVKKFGPISPNGSHVYVKDSLPKSIHHVNNQNALLSNINVYMNGSAETAIAVPQAFSLKYLTSADNGDWMIWGKLANDMDAIWTLTPDPANPGQFLDAFDGPWQLQDLINDATITELKPLKMNSKGMIAATGLKNQEEKLLLLVEAKLEIVEPEPFHEGGSVVYIGNNFNTLVPQPVNNENSAMLSLEMDPVLKQKLLDELSFEKIVTQGSMDTGKGTLILDDFLSSNGQGTIVYLAPDEVKSDKCKELDILTQRILEIAVYWNGQKLAKSNPITIESRYKYIWQYSLPENQRASRAIAHVGYKYGLGGTIPSYDESLADYGKTWPLTGTIDVGPIAMNIGENVVASTWIHENVHAAESLAFRTTTSWGHSAYDSAIAHGTPLSSLSSSDKANIATWALSELDAYYEEVVNFGHTCLDAGEQNVVASDISDFQYILSQVQ